MDKRNTRRITLLKISFYTGIFATMFIFHIIIEIGKKEEMEEGREEENTKSLRTEESPKNEY